ncbi:prepilin-type N-terminal cleavage/methylation domain-containing protein [Collimonas sp. OK412]|jgi:type IV pilus assembly protein PilV|uniref:prepilin-type N-terminal cleavage/methylation domain-containing protein n=1 Tax=Collimonas sp. (strain OK412) TaxID=1801619 RepID=UPI0008E0F16F|nr:prepilin-type N-terminal cleavage/methylation domain-containing protein [Collimonas sp. OK412]SFC61658.1 type IV pilus assembly protein PilV [Collimonas sp. OK412]
MKTPQRNHLDQSGMSLIEVLISMLIFSFAILGLVSLQVNAVKVSYGAEDRTRAALMANEIIATMWTKKTLNPSLTSWQTRLADPTVSGLPGSATGTVSGADASGVVTITITWQEPSTKSTDNYITQVAMP